jgi:hypothetical protein
MLIEMLPSVVQGMFYCDVLRLPDGNARRLKVRSIVGLLPLCCNHGYRDIAARADTVYTPGARGARPNFSRACTYGRRATLEWPSAVCSHSFIRTGCGRSCSECANERQFPSPYGVGAPSCYHAEQLYVLRVGDQEYRVDYLPAEAHTGMSGGNSNWRSPIRMALNILMVRALLRFYAYYGDTFRIECPTGSGPIMKLFSTGR